VSHDEAIDDVERDGGATVHPDDDAILDDELRIRIVLAIRSDEPELRQW
jgi:hypothetical protein